MKNKIFTSNKVFKSILMYILLPGVVIFATNSFVLQKKEEIKMIQISTNYGDIVAVLYNETPKHRDNICSLISDKYYDNLLFHRVIDGFMIQAGDPLSRNAKSNQILGNGGPGYTVPAEFHKYAIHKKGAIAAARLGDQQNPLKASSGSQVNQNESKGDSDALQKKIDEIQHKLQNEIAEVEEFRYTDEQKEIYKTIGGTPFLDFEYTVFGEVVSGFEVVEKISKVQTKNDRPIEDISMIITIKE